MTQQQQQAMLVQQRQQQLQQQQQQAMMYQQQQQRSASPPQPLFGQPMAPGDAAAWARRGGQQTASPPIQIPQQSGNGWGAPPGHQPWLPQQSGNGWPPAGGSMHQSWHAGQSFVPRPAGGVPPGRHPSEYASAGDSPPGGYSSDGYSPLGANNSPLWPVPQSSSPPLQPAPVVQRPAVLDVSEPASKAGEGNKIVGGYVVTPRGGVYSPEHFETRNGSPPSVSTHAQSTPNSAISRDASDRLLVTTARRELPSQVAARSAV